MSWDWSDALTVLGIWVVSTLIQLGILIVLAWTVTRAAELIKRVIPVQVFLYAGAALYALFMGALLVGAAATAVILTIG